MKLYIHCSGLLGYSIPSVSRVILGICLEMEGHLVVTLGEETPYVNFSGLSGYRAIHVRRVILGEWSSNGH